MLGMPFLSKRIAVTAAAFAVAAVAGIATVAIVPALASGASSGAADLAASASPSPQAGHPALRALAARRIALALFRTSVEQTGLSRVTVLKDLLNGETLAQIDGSKAQAVETAVMGKVTTRLNRAVSNGKITQAQETTLSSDASAGIDKLMNLNLSTYIRARFGGFGQSSPTIPSPAAATGSSATL